MTKTELYYVSHRDHPYLEGMGIDLYEVLPGRWKVCWRDFTSMKQDAEFGTLEEAQSYRDQVWATAHLVDRTLLEDCCMSLEDAEEIWMAIA